MSRAPYTYNRLIPSGWVIYRDFGGNQIINCGIFKTRAECRSWIKARLASWK